MDNFLVSAETVQTQSVSQPVQAQENGYDHINKMLEKKLATAIVKRHKMEYSILHFGEFNQEWLLCEVEDLASTGESLLIVVPKKNTPVTVYFH